MALTTKQIQDHRVGNLKNTTDDSADTHVATLGDCMGEVTFLMNMPGDTTEQASVKAYFNDVGIDALIEDDKLPITFKSDLIKAIELLRAN